MPASGLCVDASKNMLTWSGTVWELMGVYCETSACQHMLWQCCVSKQKWELAACQGGKHGKTPNTTTIFAKKHYLTESRNWYRIVSKNNLKYVWSPGGQTEAGGHIGVPCCLRSDNSEAPSDWLLLLMNCTVCCNMSAGTGNKSSLAILTRQSKNRPGWLMMPWRESCSFLL